MNDIFMSYNGYVRNNKELEFVVFCVENVARAINSNGAKTYQMLSSKSDIIKNYIIPEYEMLHTQSKEYIVNDIIELMKEKGLII